MLRERPGDYREGLQRFAAEHPHFFIQKLAPVAEQESNRLGALTLAAVPAMSMYDPLSDYLDRIVECNDLLRQLTDKCYAIEFLRAHLRSKKEERARALIAKYADEVVDLHFAFQSKLGDLRLQLAAVEGVNPLAISGTHDELDDPGRLIPDEAR